MEEDKPVADITQDAPKKRKFMVIMLLVCLAAAGAGFYWWHLLQTTISTDNAKVTTDISDISFRVGGRLDALLVDEGDQVKKGQVLARLDNEQYRIATEQARAALDTAQANYARLPYDLQSKSILVEKARDQVAIAATAVKTAEISREDAQRILSKNEELYKNGAIAEETLNASRSNYQKAETALQSARLSLQSSQTGLRDSEQQQAAAGKTQEPVMLAGIRQAQAAYEAAAFNYRNSVLQAPLTGLVVRTAAQPGETLSPGQTVLSLARPGNIWVTANIEEKKISRLQKGQRVEIRIDAYPGKVFTGKVKTVGEVSQSTFALFSGENASGNFTKVSQRIPVKISVNSQGLVLKPGTSAVVKIYTAD